MVKDTLPWHEREDEDSEDSFTVSTNQPSGRFNADEIEFESFMFDPGTGPLAKQSEPSVRVDAVPSVATMSSPLESQVVDPTSDAGFDSAQVPASLEAAPSGNGSGDHSPLEPWPTTPNASVDFSPARGISPIAIAGHEVPMPSYLRADDAETPSQEAELPASMQTAPDLSAQMEAQPAVQIQESEPSASRGDEQPVAIDSVQPSTDTGPTQMDGVPEIGAPSDAITQAVRALSETGPLRAGRRPPRSTGPLGARSTGPAGSAGPSSTPPEQPTPIASPLASSVASATSAPVEDRWSDSYLSQLEDFSLVLLAARTEKRPPATGTSPTVITRPSRSSAGASAVIAPEPEQQTLDDVPRDSAGVAPFDQVAEPEQPAGMLPGSMDTEQVEQRPDLEPEDAMAASMAPIAADGAEAVEEVQVAEPDAADVADTAEAPEMAQVSESATLVGAASPEDEPVVSEGRFSGDVIEFEAFMFDAAAQPGPPLPNPEEFAPAVAEIANALEGVEDVAPFAPIGDAALQEDMLAQASAEAQGDVMELPQPQAEPEPAASSTVPPASSLPFWLKDTGDLQSALSLGHIHIEEQPPVASAEQEPHMGTIEAEPVSGEIALAAGVDDAQAEAQVASVEAVEEVPLDDYSDLPPIEPFDVSALMQPEDEETFGFDTEELTGSFLGSKEALIVTTDLDALADLLGTSNMPPEASSDVVSQRATPDTAPAMTSREEITGRLSPDMADRPRTPSWTSTVTSNLDMDPTGALADMPSQQAAEQGADDIPVLGIEQPGAVDLDYAQVDPFDFTDLNLDPDESDTMVFRMPVAPSTGMLETDTGAPSVSSSYDLLDEEAEVADRGTAVAGALETEQAARGTDMLEGGVESVQEVPASSNWQTRSWLDAEDLPSGGPSEEALLASEVPLFEEAEPQEFWPAEGEPPTGWLGDTELPAFHATEELAEPVPTQSDAPVQPEESQPVALDTSDVAAVAASAEMPDLPLLYVQQEEPSRDQPPDWEHTGPLPQIDDAEQPEDWAPAGLEETHDIAAMQVEMPTGWLAEPDTREAWPGRDEADTGSLSPGPEMEAQPVAADEDATRPEPAEVAMPQETLDEHDQIVPSVRVARADWAERRLMEMQDNDEAAFMDAGNTFYTSEEGFTMATNRDNENADQQPAAGGRAAQSKGGGFPFPPKLLSSGPLPELDSFNELQDMVNRNPDDLSAHMALAAAYTQAGELDPALRVYRRLLKKRNLSTTMMQMIADELAEFERDVSGQPRYHQVLGDLYMKQGLYREAIEEYNKIG